MNVQNLKDFMKRKTLLVAVIILVLLAMIGLFRSLSKPGSVSMLQRNNASKDIGISVGGVEQQAYMARLEKNYYDFEDRVKEVEGQIKNMQSTAEKIEGSQKDLAQSVLKLDQSLGLKIEQKLGELKNVLEASQIKKDPALPSTIELSIADINPSLDKDWVYLPIGSFCQGTLLTGVYAAADANNPLPVLISLDEAFYGPNKTRIPLKGAFVLGKAYGDLTSERALIQIVAISTVLPSGKAFENEENLGYVTDEWGELGIKGKLIYNTGRQLALSFMGGFVSGGAQAMADSEVSTHKTAQGDSTKNVTGNTGKNALFSGLAQSAGKLSQFYERQAEELVPAIHITNGSKVYFIVQKGIPIHGLATEDLKQKRFIE